MSSVSPFFTDQLLFIVFPYVAFVVFILFSIRRYLMQSFTYSSLSSQFLENKQHFWGLVPFHYGIIVILTGHFVAFLIPREIIAWNNEPLRLYILEIAAFVFALLTLIGLTSIIIRRFTTPKMKIVTSPADWILLTILGIQVLSGMFVAVFHSWGSTWYAATATPYLWSLITFNPDISYITAMPWMVKVHIIGAFVIITFFPFTRLVHALVVPNPYLWRKPQVVRWYGIKRLIRQSTDKTVI